MDITFPCLRIFELFILQTNTERLNPGTLSVVFSVMCELPPWIKISHPQILGELKYHMPLFALGTQCLSVISITFGFQAEDCHIVFGDVLSIFALVKTTSKENLITWHFQHGMFFFSKPRLVSIKHFASKTVNSLAG